MTAMRRAPKAKAYCTFCEKVRALLASGHPFKHGGLHGEKLCYGAWHEAQRCPACNGVRTVRQRAENHTCSTCKGTGRIVT